MKKIICEKCRKPVALADNFCGHCGSKFITDKVNEGTPLTPVGLMNKLRAIANQKGKKAVTRVVNRNKGKNPYPYTIEIKQTFSDKAELREKTYLDTKDIDKVVRGDYAVEVDHIQGGEPLSFNQVREKGEVTRITLVHVQGDV